MVNRHNIRRSGVQRLRPSNRKMTDQIRQTVKGKTHITLYKNTQKDG